MVMAVADGRAAGELKRQTSLTRGARTDADLLKFNRSVSRIALPREVHEVSEIKNIRKSLGRERLIEFQYVSSSSPKPFVLLQRPHHGRCVVVRRFTMRPAIRHG